MNHAELLKSRPRSNWDEGWNAAIRYVMDHPALDAQLLAKAMSIEALGSPFPILEDVQMAQRILDIAGGLDDDHQ